VEQPESCVLVIFGGAGDLTRRLLVPALYNLACDGLLPRATAILAVSLDDLSTETFRARLGTDIRRFCTRAELDVRVWDDLAARVHYESGRFEDPETYRRLAVRIADLGASHGTAGRVIFYLATPPVVFGLIAGQLAAAGLHRTEAPAAWRRLVVEKPFGKDLDSARALNRQLLQHWSEDQIFRIDHYLGKETVQNLLAFRFSNGIFEPLWNRQQIDHIQFTVSESVGVESRGRYYDSAGVLRDMVQNHMFQMLAYLCMEPPSSLRADTVRNEKAEVLDAIRIMRPEEVLANTVRGQYGPSNRADGGYIPGYREEPDVNPQSNTETFCAIQLHIDSWRWEGVPIYLRSGKSLWKRGTEIVVHFKRAPEVIFRNVPEVGHLENNQLIFHIQPDQGIELRFQAKSPGPSMSLQRVDMRFDYHESFEASRSTGYEVLLYHCMRGDATLFTRNDLVETAWQVAQPILDTWADNPPRDFPNYPAGTWGPKGAFELLARQGRKWTEVIHRGVLEKVPLFAQSSPVLLRGMALVLRPAVFAAGEEIVRQGEPGSEMYILARGEVKVRDGARVLATLGPGGVFGERSLLLSEPRSATVVAKTQVDAYVLGKTEFLRVLREHPRFARSMLDVARERLGGDDASERTLDSLLARFVDRGGA
jgi:glucose-6-phosphate 1-dehydrogenase